MVKLLNILLLLFWATVSRHYNTHWLPTTEHIQFTTKRERERQEQIYSMLAEVVAAAGWLINFNYFAFGFCCSFVRRSVSWLVGRLFYQQLLDVYQAKQKQTHKINCIKPETARQRRRQNWLMILMDSLTAAGRMNAREVMRVCVFRYY